MAKIPTGCTLIDRILGGGIPSDGVSLVYGEPETGKTTIAIQCSMNCALQGYRTLFVDCDGSFMAQRLFQVASRKSNDVAKLVILARPQNLREQAAVIDNLAEYTAKSFGLVVLDTVTSLYRLQVAQSPSKTFELNRELNRQLAMLAQFAKTRKIAVLLTSQVRTVFDEPHVGVEPVATRVLRFWADVIVHLKPAQSQNMITAHLEETPQGASSAICNLKIDETGIHDQPVR